MRPGWLEVGAMLAIGLSLAPKFLTLGGSVEEDTAQARRDLGAALTRQGYAVAVPRPDLPIVRAEHKGCTLMARVLDPHGTLHDTELLKLRRGWTVTYLWRGRAYSSLPRFGPLRDYFFAREQARIGIEAHRAPVVMVSHPANCAAPAIAAHDVQLRLVRGSAR